MAYNYKVGNIGCKGKVKARASLEDITVTVRELAFIMAEVRSNSCPVLLYIPFHTRWGLAAWGWGLRAFAVGGRPNLQCSLSSYPTIHPSWWGLGGAGGGGGQGWGWGWLCVCMRACACACACVVAEGQGLCSLQFCNRIVCYGCC